VFFVYIAVNKNICALKTLDLLKVPSFGTFNNRIDARCFENRSRMNKINY
jgi:hypothetical protein